MSDVTPPPAATPYAAAATGPKTNVLAIIALVSGIVGLFFGLFSLAAVVMGHIAMSQIKKTGESGRGMAVAALILGYVGIVLGIIVVIFSIVFPLFVLGTSGLYNY